MEDNDMLEYFGVSQAEIDAVDDEFVQKVCIGYHGLQDELATYKKINEELLKERDELIQSTENTSQKDEMENLREDVKRYQNECSELSKIKDSLLNSDMDTKKFINDLELSSKRLKSEFKFLQEDFLDKENQLKSSSDLIKKLLEENRTSQIEKSSLLIKEEELKSQENRLKSKEEYLNKEIDLLRSENIKLHEQLSEANSKLLTSRSELQDKCISLELELKESKHQLEIFKSMAEKKREISDNLTLINQEYLEKIKFLQENQLNSHEKFETEVESLKKLLKVYKETTSDYESQIETFQANINQMQKSLDEGVEIIRDLHKEKEELCNEKDSIIEKERAHSNVLKQELDRSKELFEKFRISSLSEEELSNLNPAVASTIGALKRGKSLTEIYADYIQIVEEREMLKLDNKRLNEQVKVLFEELELKRPSLKADVEDFQRIKKHLADSLDEIEILRNSNKKMSSAHAVNQRKISYISRQNERLKNNCHNLACQLKVLLAELEISKGTVIRGNKADDSFNHSFISVEDGKNVGHSDNITSKVYQIANNTISNSLNLIDENLITYRNIAELVIQNQRLLVITHDLISQLETKESEEEAIKGTLKEFEVKANLISEQAELNKLTLNERNTELELIKNQRDSYKKLLEKYEIGIPQSDEIIDITPQNSCVESPNKTPKNISMTSRQNENLIEVIESLKEEYRKYRDDKKDSDIIFSKTIDDLRNKLNESILKSQKLVSKLEFSEEKFKVLELNVAGYKEEINLLREMNARYSASAAAADAEMLRLREDLLRNIEKESKFEASLQRLTSELEQTKASEAYLKSENQSLRSNEMLHSQISNYINSLQLSLEYRESTDRQIDGHRLINLENQIKEMRSAHEYEKNEWFESKQLLIQEASELRKKLEEYQIEFSEIREKLTSNQRELEISKKEVDHFKRNSLFGLDPSQDHSAESSDLKSQLIKATEKISQLEVALESSKKLQEEFKAISLNSETRLSEILEQNVVIQTKLQTEVDEYEIKLKLLAEKLDLREKERQALERENIRINEEAHQMNSQLKEDIQELKQHNEQLKEKAESAELHEKEARSEFQSLLDASEESKRKYERELCLHAQDLDLLTQLREKIDQLKKENEKLKADTIRAQAEMVSARVELENQVRDFEEKKRVLEENKNSVEKNNDVLHVELVKLSEQLVKMRKLMNEEGDKMVKEVLSSQIEDIKTSEDLLQVVEYLRKQKHILESNLDLSSMEISRLMAKSGQLENKTKTLQDDLNKEREERISKSMTSAQIHNEMISKIDQCNLLNESNQLLRQERDVLRQKLNRLEQDFTILENEMQPVKERLQEKSNELDRMSTLKASLEEERNRWKERCVNLVESAQRVDPEAYQQACQERDEFSSELDQLRLELEAKQREFVDKVTNLTHTQTSLEKSLESKQSELTETRERLTDVTAKNESLSAEVSKNSSVIIKLRELARKYKTEAESSNKASLLKDFTAAKEKLAAAQADLIKSNQEVTKLSDRLEIICQLIVNIHTDMADVPEDLTLPKLPSLEGALEKKIKTLGDVLKLRQDKLIQLNKSQQEKLFRLKMLEAQLAKYRQKSEEAAHSTGQSDLNKSDSNIEPIHPPPPQQQQQVKPATTVQRQTAEIRPITSNIATVVPTLSANSHIHSVEPQQQVPPPVHEEQQPSSSGPSSSLFSMIPTPQNPISSMVSIANPIFSQPTDNHSGQTFGQKRTRPGNDDDDDSQTTATSSMILTFDPHQQPTSASQPHQIQTTDGFVENADDGLSHDTATKRMRPSETPEQVGLFQSQLTNIQTTSVGSDENQLCYNQENFGQFDQQQNENYDTTDSIQLQPISCQKEQILVMTEEETFNIENPYECQPNVFTNEDHDGKEDEQQVENEDEDEEVDEDEEEDEGNGEDDDEVIELSSDADDGGEEAEEGEANDNISEQGAAGETEDEEEDADIDDDEDEEDEEVEAELEEGEENEESDNYEEENEGQQQLEYEGNEEEDEDSKLSQKQEQDQNEMPKPSEITTSFSISANQSPMKTSSGLFGVFKTEENRPTSLFGSIKTTPTTSNLFSFSNPINTRSSISQACSEKDDDGKPAQIQPITWVNQSVKEIDPPGPTTDDALRPVNKRKKKWGNSSASGPLKKQGPRFVN